MIGRTLSHYRILAKIGAGGDGEVYRAEDLTLNRDIALKVLPPGLAENDERRARFSREAQTIAALNHPNIVAVHSVADGMHFITMELVRGRPLPNFCRVRDSRWTPFSTSRSPSPMPWPRLTTTAS